MQIQRYNKGLRKEQMIMGNINLKINGLNVSAPEGSTILEAAHIAGIKIPTLCFLKDIN